MKKGKYSTKMVEKITDMIRSDTYTIREISKSVGIDTQTYHDWINNHPEFAEAVEQAKDDRIKLFAAEAKKSLLKKIKGYTVQEKHVTYTDSKEIDGATGKPKPKIKEQKVIDKHILPDTAAIIFTLTNVEPEQWRNRQFVDTKVTQAQPVTINKNYGQPETDTENEND
jgi:transposase-like protein